MTLAIPKGWELVPVDDLARLNPREVPTNLADETEVSFVPMSAVEEGTGRMQVKGVRPWREVRKGYTRFQEGDVLFAKITPCMENGKVALAEGLINGVGAGSTEFHVLRPRNGVLADYLVQFLLQERLRSDARLVMKGAAGQLRVPAKFLSSLPMPLPPTAEQRRIVAAIEEHLSRLDAAVAALERVRAALPRYRAAVLKAACEGRLVETEAQLALRASRQPETGADLLKAIRAERALASDPSLPTRGGLPPGWVSTSIEELAFVGTGSTPLKSNAAFYDGGDVPWVTSAALNESTVRASRTFVTRLAVKENRLRQYAPGTLLVAMYGEGRTRGKSAELRIEATINQAIAAIQLQGIAGNCRSYLKVVLANQYEELRRASSGGVQPNLNLSIIKAIQISLPPLVEQGRIVAEVDRRLSLADAADRAVSAGLAKAKRLRQAILKRAFEGRLVPQDPNDEPASVLLDRIRAERK